MTSKQEYFLSNAIALFSVLTLEVTRHLGWSTNLVDGVRFVRIALSVGVAYGIETFVLTFFNSSYEIKRLKLGRIEGLVEWAASGISTYAPSIKQNSNQLVKVVSLIVISYLLLSNPTKQQTTITNIFYALSFAVFLAVVVIKADGGLPDKEEIDPLSGLSIFIFFFGIALILVLLIFSAFIRAPILIIASAFIVSLLLAVPLLLRGLVKNADQSDRETQEPVEE